MKKASISSTMDLTNGGCNVCRTVTSVSYLLTIDDSELLLDGLTVTSLVMAVVLHDRWKSAFVVEMMDEYTCYTKDSVEVKLTEEYIQLIYDNGKETIETLAIITDKKQLFSQVNRILTTIFGIDEVEFEMADEVE